MLKLAGSVLIVLTGAGIGYSKADKLVKLHKNIRSVIGMLNEIYIMLDSSCLTTEEIVSDLKGNEKYNDLSFIFTEDNYLSINEENKQDYLRKNKSEYLEYEDMMRLMDFFAQLGSTDLKGQLSRVRLCINEFTVREKAYAEKSRRYARLYRGMGILSGAMTAVMLI